MITTVKDDTNISDGEEDTQIRGRVNSMRTNIRELTGSVIDLKSRDPSTNTKELSKNNSFQALKNLMSSS